jgi:hypothetical protein
MEKRPEGAAGQPLPASTPRAGAATSLSTQPRRAAGVGARRGPQGRAARESHFVATRNVPKCLHGRGEAGGGGARARLCGLTEGGSRRHASAVREGER